MKTKSLSILLFLAAATTTLNAQSSEQPTIPFPFQMTLFRPDSTPVASAKVLQTGKPTILAFWLTTCMPCQIEFATYTQKLAAWKQEADFQLFGISIDFPQRFRQIKVLADEKKWPFPVYWDKSRAFTEILPGALNGLPQVFLFDRNGTLVWRHKGFHPGDENELWARVKELK
jgi:thiol-disulfide isomerase/thioredoxin